MNVESLSVNIFLNKMKIQCVVAYGCQENDNVHKKNMFWKYLSEEVCFAKGDGAAFLLQFDGNLWAGPKLIPGDPRRQNRNGKLFEKFLLQNDLTVVNSLQLCEGLIKRERIFKDGKIERSILDFFVVCKKL